MPPQQRGAVAPENHAFVVAERPDFLPGPFVALDGLDRARIAQRLADHNFLARLYFALAPGQGTFRACAGRAKADANLPALAGEIPDPRTGAGLVLGPADVEAACAGGETLPYEAGQQAARREGQLMRA